MITFNPFSKESLEWIFKKKDDKDDKVVRRESTTLDFKENFNFNALDEYGKFGASFSNRKGGYLVFGVKDKPHLLLGMQNEQFENLDAGKVSTIFNDYFSPSLVWDSYTYELDGKKFGLIYFYEASDKPIITIKNSNKGNFSEGEIYYRYSGQSRKIRYFELNEILSEKIQKEKNEWLDFFRSAMQFKPDSVLLLDLKSGIIDSNNHSILIDENILEKLKFIKEGEFSEKKGAPTLRLVGEISETIQGHNTKIVEKKVPTPFVVTTEKLFEAFFNQLCESPTEYLKQFCYESTAYLPIWFFIECSKKSTDEMEVFWESLNDVKEATRTTLLNRLFEDTVDSYKIGKLIDIEVNLNSFDIEFFDDISANLLLELNLPKSRDNTVKRSLLYRIIMSDKEYMITEDFIRRKPISLYVAISHLPTDTVIEKKEWILNVLSVIHSLKLKKISMSNYRKSICSVDIKLSKSKMD